MKRALLILRQNSYASVVFQGKEEIISQPEELPCNGPFSLIFDFENASFERLNLSQLSWAERIRFLMKERHQKQPLLTALISRGYYRYQKITLSLSEPIKQWIDFFIQKEIPIASLSFPPLYLLSCIPQDEWAILLRSLGQHYQLITFSPGHILFMRTVTGDLEKEVIATKQFMRRFGCEDEQVIKVYMTEGTLPETPSHSLNLKKEDFFQKCVKSRKSKIAFGFSKIPFLSFILPRLTFLICVITCCSIGIMMPSLGSHLVDQSKNLDKIQADINQMQAYAKSISHFPDLDLYEHLKDPIHEKVFQVIDRVTPLILQKGKAKALSCQADKLSVVLDPLSSTDLRILMRLLSKAVPDYNLSLKISEHSKSVALILEKKG